MSKLLIFIGEGQKFDLAQTIQAVSSLSGASKCRSGEFIGAIFECELEYAGLSTVLRISPDAETITSEGLGDESLAFALELQRALPVALRAIDMDYSFDVALAEHRTLDQLRSSIAT